MFAERCVFPVPQNTRPLASAATINKPIKANHLLCKKPITTIYICMNMTRIAGERARASEREKETERECDKATIAVLDDAMTVATTLAGVEEQR